MTTDDMREIEAELNSYRSAVFLEDGTTECIDRTRERREKLLAMIRSKLPQAAGSQPICRGDFDVDLHNDGRGTVAGLHFTMKWKDSGEVTRFVPEQAVDMREIQMAVMNYGSHRFHDGRSGAGREHVQRTDAALDKAMNLIRQKLPPSDAEHERAVEAWHSVVLTWTDDGERYCISRGQLAEALRLMRARPAVNDQVEALQSWQDGVIVACGSLGLQPSEVVAHIENLRADRDATHDEMQQQRARAEAAGGLLRAAKEAGFWMSAALSDPSACREVKDAFGKVLDAIEGAERAGVKP